MPRILQVSPKLSRPTKTQERSTLVLVRTGTVMENLMSSTRSGRYCIRFSYILLPTRFVVDAEVTAGRGPPSCIQSRQGIPSHYWSPGVHQECDQVGLWHG